MKLYLRMQYLYYAGPRWGYSGPAAGLLLLVIAGASDGVLYSSSGHLLHMSGGGIG